MTRFAVAEPRLLASKWRNSGILKSQLSVATPRAADRSFPRRLPQFAYAMGDKALRTFFVSNKNTALYANATLFFEYPCNKTKLLLLPEIARSFSGKRIRKK